MKTSLVLCLFMGLLIHATSAEETAKLKFQTYSGYFVSNKFEPDSSASFVVLDNRKQFGQVFGVAFVIGDKSSRPRCLQYPAGFSRHQARQGLLYLPSRLRGRTGRGGATALPNENQEKRLGYFRLPVDPLDPKWEMSGSRVLRKRQTGQASVDRWQIT